jgi:hypothetical protein
VDLQEISIAQVLSSNVPESAQDICRNWLIKISSIRELLPRCLIEITLLRLHFFMDKGAKATSILTRLAKSNRCLGDGLNRILYLTFLVRVASEVVPREKDYLRLILQDTFLYMKQGQQLFGRKDLPFEDYMAMIQPFFRTAFAALSVNCQLQDFHQVFASLPPVPHPSLLRSFLALLPRSHLTTVSVELAVLVGKLPESCRLGMFTLLLERIEAWHVRGRELAGLIFKEGVKATSLAEYLAFLGAFLQHIFGNYQGPERTQLTGLLMDRLTALCDSISYDLEGQLADKMVSCISTVLKLSSEAMVLDPLLQMVSRLSPQTARHISRAILQ